MNRTWRPKTFGDMVGQEALVRTLKNAVSAGQVAHAYLFSGERGIGKTSAARILARAVNCLKPQAGEPCNVCENCLTILANRTLDIIEIDGASNRGIDHIRQLREEVSFVPSDLRMKVYIIDEVHMLTNEAFNALLKTLEEPPSHSMFVFATTEAHKVPRTILSRCQVFDFRRIDAAAIALHLQKVAESLELDITRDATQLIAQRANGGMRDALVMLEQVASYAGEQISADTVLDMLGLADTAVHEAFLETVQQGDQATLVALIDELVDRGKDLEVFLSDVVNLLRARLRIPSAHSREEIRLSQGLLEIKADMFRSLDRRIRFEIGVLALMESLQTQRSEPKERAAGGRSEPKGSADRGKPQSPTPSSVQSPTAPPVRRKVRVALPVSERRRSGAESAPSPMGGSWISMLMLFAVFGAIFYFMLIRPQRKRQTKMNELIAGLKRGDLVVTAGGIYGEVDSIGDNTAVLILEDGAKLKMAKASIVQKREK